jgi:transglutaminase-like putative cysteine protease
MRAGAAEHLLTYQQLVRPTEFFDYDSLEVREFVDHVIVDRQMSPREKAVRLYYAVRDEVHYEVYDVDLSRMGVRASSIVRAGQGFCLHKSILYAATVRSVGVPSRLIFADVRNHLASDRLKRLVGGEVFFHVLTSVYLDGRWLKATPVFNKLLCRLYGIPALEFDGTADSAHHPFGEDGETHMEFLAEHGAFDDLPYDYVLDTMRRKHPSFLTGSGTVRGGSLAAEATRTVEQQSRNNQILNLGTDHVD